MIHWGAISSMSLCWNYYSITSTQFAPINAVVLLIAITPYNLITDIMLHSRNFLSAHSNDTSNQSSIALIIVYKVKSASSNLSLMISSLSLLSNIAMCKLMDYLVMRPEP